MVTSDPLTMDGALLALSGTLHHVRHRTSNQGRAWCTATLTTSTGSVAVRVAPMVYAAHPVTSGQAVTVAGRVDRRSAPPRLDAHEIMTVRTVKITDRLIRRGDAALIGDNGSPRGRS